jgi:hypothetical protein
MAKLIIGLGFATSLAIFAIAMLGASATGEDATPKNEPPKTATLAGCTVEELPLDEGYGVSRTTVRLTCAK